MKRGIAFFLKGRDFEGVRKRVRGKVLVYTDGFPSYLSLLGFEEGEGGGAEGGGKKFWLFPGNYRIIDEG